VDASSPYLLGLLTPTDAVGLLGTDVLKESGAMIDLECNKTTFTNIGKKARAYETLTERTTLTIFTKDKDGHSLQLSQQEARHMKEQFPADTRHERATTHGRTGVVKATEIITMAPRSNK
jgi:hypothetical protein